MNLETNLIEEQLGLVREEYRRRMTGGDGDLLRQVEAYSANRTGKMLRPRMLLATAVEMLHNASLLHDDVIDRDLTRRGQPSVNAQWNNAVAVLVGDYHLVSIMQLLSEVGDQSVTDRFIATVKSMVEAELLQQDYSATQPLSSPATYLKIIDGKTANLFALAAELGDPALRDYGLHGEATPFTQQLIEQEEKALQEINL